MSDDYEYLAIAWAQAAPIAAREAFDRCLVNLAPETTQTLALQAELEAWLRTRAYEQSLEGLDALRRRAWFGPGKLGRAQRLEGFLHDVAAQYLVLDGGRCVLRGIDTSARTDTPVAARRWRWLSLVLPPDLLIAALASASGTEPISDDVVLTPFHVERILERGVSETHVHIGGAIGFPLLWSSWIADPDFDPPSGGDAPFGDWTRFSERTWAASIARLLLAGFLAEQERRPRTAERQLASYVGSRAPGLDGSLVPFHPSEVRTMYSKALAALLGGARVPGSLALERRFYRRLSHRAAILVAVPVSAMAYSRDPLASWLVPSDCLASPECRFTARALRYLRSGCADDLFRRLFWQYVRVRVETFRFLTQEPGTAGLGWFRTFYRRIDTFRRGAADSSLGRAAIEHAGLGTRLQSIELRCEPSRDRSRLLRRVAATARSAVQHAVLSGREPAEVGLVMHLRKEPEELHDSVRFGRLGRLWHAQAAAIEWMLEVYPETLLVLRGVDVAGGETFVPNWTTRAALLRIRSASSRACRVLASTHPRLRIEPLRATFHAGEEYRRLVEGLRRIDEVIELGVVTPGDRIGHGLALSEPPERAESRCALAHQTREDRLDDLLWELDRYANGDFPVDGARTEIVRAEVNRRVREIYGRALDVDAVRLARRKRAKQAARLGWPLLERRPTVAGGDVRAQIVSQYLFDPGVRARGLAIIEVEHDASETAMLRCAQTWLRRRLARLQATVEANPSSNHLVSDLASLDEHPALSLQPLREQGRDDTVLLSINSDDPLTFATKLSDEFAYTYFALLRHGVSTQDALAWLDRIRENGVRSRFTSRASSRIDAMAALLARLPFSSDEKAPT